MLPFQKFTLIEIEIQIDRIIYALLLWLLSSFSFFFFLFQREIKRRSRQQSNKLSPTVSIFVWTDAKKSTDSHPRPHFRHSYRVEFRSPPVRIPFARGFCKQSRARWKRNCPTKLSGDREDQEVIAVDSAGKDNTRE